MRISELAEVTLRRFGETLLSCVLISSGLTLIYNTERLKNTEAVNWIVALAGLGVFLLVSVLLMRRCRFVLGRDGTAYIVTNCIAWALFTGVHQTTLAAAGAMNTIYSYGFRLGSFGELAGMRAWESAALLDVILLATVFASQLGMRPILQEAEREINAHYE